MSVTPAVPLTAPGAPIRFRPAGWPLPSAPGVATLFGPVDETELDRALRSPRPLTEKPPLC